MLIGTFGGGVRRVPPRHRGEGRTAFADAARGAGAAEWAGPLLLGRTRWPRHCLALGTMVRVHEISSTRLPAPTVA